MNPSEPTCPGPAAVPSNYSVDQAFAATDRGPRAPRATARVLNAGPLAGLEPNQCRIVPHGKSSIGVYGRLGSTYRPVGAAAAFEEVLCDRVLRCPWHGWEFDVVSGQGLYDARSRVRTYPVRLNSDQEIEILV